LISAETTSTNTCKINRAIRHNARDNFNEYMATDSGSFSSRDKAMQGVSWVSNTSLIAPNIQGVLERAWYKRPDSPFLTLDIENRGRHVTRLILHQQDDLTTSDMKQEHCLDVLSEKDEVRTASSRPLAITCSWGGIRHQ
jgi:hypothetical protein